MRITLYRTDIEAAVRSHMARLFNFPAADMLIQHGEGMIQVDLGAGPDSQNPSPQTGLAGAAEGASLNVAKSLGLIDNPSVTSVLQALPPTPFTGVFSGLKKAGTPTPAAVEQVAEASLVNAAAESSIATALETPKVSETPEVIGSGPTDGPTSTEEVYTDQVPANDSAAELVTEPPRKVQSLFKNLKKPVNG